MRENKKNSANIFSNFLLIIKLIGESFGSRCERVKRMCSVLWRTANSKWEKRNINKTQEVQEP